MKGQTRNIETFKVGATKVNEFDFHKHQGEMHEHAADEKPTPSATRTRAEQVAEITRQAHEKVLRRKKRR